MAYADSANTTIPSFADAPIHTPVLDRGADRDFHMVEMAFGKVRYFREIEAGRTGFGDVVEDILAGQIDHPVRVYAFNPCEGWARDVSEDVALAVAAVAWREERSISDAAREFVEAHAGLRMARGLQITEAGERMD